MEEIDKQMNNFDKSELLKVITYSDDMDIKDMGKIGHIVPNFNLNDMSVYKGKDELLYIDRNETDFSNEENRKKLIELCDICPDIIVRDTTMHYSTANEIKKGEKWVESILKGIHDDWTDIQKVAYIDKCFGREKVYMPEYELETNSQKKAELERKSKPLWAALASNEVVCYGIANAENYIFKRLGIKSRIITSGTHAFILLEDIDIPQKDGTSMKGNTLLDTTWNLDEARFGGIPTYFGRAYKDIKEEENNNPLAPHISPVLDSVDTTEIDYDVLKEQYLAADLLDRYDKYKELWEQATEIVEGEPIEELIRRRLQAIVDTCPECANCVNETNNMISGLMFWKLPTGMNKCIVSKAYKKNDQDKKAVSLIYFDLGSKGTKIMCADKENGGFTELTQQEFKEKYSCYDSLRNLDRFFMEQKELDTPYGTGDDR